MLASVRGLSFVSCFLLQCIIWFHVSTRTTVPERFLTVKTSALDVRCMCTRSEAVSENSIDESLVDKHRQALEQNVVDITNGRSLATPHTAMISRFNQRRVRNWARDLKKCDLLTAIRHQTRML